VSPVLLVLISEVCLCRANELRELAVVLGSYILESQDSSLLLVDNCSETSLVLDNDVGDSHLSAKSRNENDKLDGVDIVGDDYEVGLLVLNQGNAVVETHLDKKGLLSILLWLLSIVGSDSLSLLVETCLLLLLCFRAVLV